MTAPKIALLLTGNELMTGDIVDSNSAMIAEQFLDQGFEVAYKVTVADDMPLLVSEMERLSKAYDMLLVNGGLGPTTDDLTAEALAQAMSVEIAEHPAAMSHLESWCEKRNYPLNAQNLKQAMLPASVDIVPNVTGSAVGFSCLLNQCLVVCTPGVPVELETMLTGQVLPLMHRHFPTNQQPKRHRLRVFGMGESGLQKRISETYPNMPEELEIGYRASMPLLELKLKVHQVEHYPILDEWYTKIHSLLGHHVVTEDQRSIAHVVKDLLLEADKKITFAESCTGGLIASLMTEVSGSSGVFDAGFVTYSNEAKHRMINVSEQNLMTHGAVSEVVVKEMLHGALNQSGADLGVAVSGIAGPTGGSDEKPVGTVWIAWGSLENIQARQFYFPGNRLYFQKIVAALGLDLIRRELISSHEEPVYFKERVKK